MNSIMNSVMNSVTNPELFSFAQKIGYCYHSYHFFGFWSKLFNIGIGFYYIPPERLPTSKHDFFWSIIGSNNKPITINYTCGSGTTTLHIYFIDNNNNKKSINIYTGLDNLNIFYHAQAHATEPKLDAIIAYQHRNGSISFCSKLDTYYAKFGHGKTIGDTLNKVDFVKMMDEISIYMDYTELINFDKKVTEYGHKFEYMSWFTNYDQSCTKINTILFDSIFSSDRSDKN